MDVAEVTALKEKLATLKQLDLPLLRARVELIAAQAELDDEASSIAHEAGADQEVVLIVLRAVWMAQLDATVHDHCAVVDRDSFKAKVRAGTLTLLDTLATGEMEFDDPVLRAAMKTAVAYGRTHDRFVPIRQELEQVLCVVQGLPCER